MQTMSVQASNLRLAALRVVSGHRKSFMYSVHSGSRRLWSLAVCWRRRCLDSRAYDRSEGLVLRPLARLGGG